MPSSPAFSAMQAPDRLTQIEAGEVCLTDRNLPLQHRHGRVRLAEALEVGELALSRFAPSISGDQIEQAAFIDVEATGLAGGTGTLAFLIGVGTFEGAELRLRQFFIRDPSNEDAMLSALDELLCECPLIVSFNGKSFDLPLLESRFILNRLRPPFAGIGHIDLLHPARRLYGRRLASCRLASLEESVLGLSRPGDIPGWAVPRIYFDYLRCGSIARLGQVFRHNRLDVISLVALLAHLGGVAGAEEPEDPWCTLALARWDEARGEYEGAIRLYRAALYAPGDFRAALRGLIRAHRRLGRWRELQDTLAELLASQLPTSARLDALTEFAKLLEHRLRDAAAAEGVVREALSLLDVLALCLPASSSVLPTRDGLARRLLRLRRQRRRQRLASADAGSLSATFARPE